MKKSTGEQVAREQQQGLTTGDAQKALYKGNKYSNCSTRNIK